MKKYLLSAIIASTVFFSAQVKAAPSNSDCKPTPPRDPKGTAHLPINNGVVFLMIAGIVIGVTTVNKAKSLKAVAVKA